jgi:MFS family permease
VNLSPYRAVLAVPGMRSLLLVGILARVPATAIGITLTLHVTSGLGRSWAQAGLVTAAYTVGAAIGQPLTGRLMDRRGMRTAMVVTGGVAALVWGVAPHLSYPWLLAAAAVGGLFGLPIFSAVRLSIGAIVPAASRKPAFALDSMITELSYMVGPAVAVALATSLPTGYGLYALATGLVAGAGLMCWLNPPTQPEGQEVPEVAPSRRTWFSSRLVALMVAGAAATFVLTGTELAVVATLRRDGVPQWTGIAVAVWCAYSLIGGLVFGAVRRHVPALVLVGAMGMLTIPVGLVSGWPWLLLALLPCGVLCAPSMISANENLTRIVPPAARGEANGLVGSAFTVGTALGAPFAGAVIDATSPGWAYAAGGMVTLLAVAVALPASRAAGRRPSAAIAEQARPEQALAKAR